MELVSPILDVVTRVWNCAAKRAVYIKDLQEKMEALRNAMQQLKERRDDVKERVLEGEGKQPRTKCTNEVKGWLDRVQEMEKVVDEILGKDEQEIQKKSIFQRSVRTSYKLGKKASKMLPAVTQLWSTGHFDVVVHTLRQPRADERPMQETVGLEPMYEEVCRCIQDDGIGVIGLYGMGGAGKTTLMNKLNNDFIGASKDFDVTIWVVVSRPANLGKVQEVIRNKLNIPDATWRNRSPDERAVQIFNTLKSKRFVLLLDDVWERLDLQQVGVPSPKQYSHNRSKVILTTRSLDVCRHMEAQRSIKVICLTEDDAVDLFKRKVGEATLNSHPEIPQLAEIAARECQGLPLALVTIGRAMAGKNTPEEWERAIQTLKSYPSEFSGVADQVFPVLKFSYDNLPNETIKACFLYLAIFPEDREILIEDLIMLWIGEGILDEWGNIEDTFNVGHGIIDHLKTACLFETGELYDSLKLHDVIRDMALWLATAYAGNKNKILVQEVDDVAAAVVHLGSKLKDAQRMYLQIKKIGNVNTVPPSFPNLVTLMVRGTFPLGFFQFLPMIKVMNLSETTITKLPIGIGKVVTLEYLNLSGTRLTEVSSELKTLKNLRCLLLNDMLRLKRICKGVISNLSMMRFVSLEIYNYRNLPYIEYDNVDDACNGVELLEEVEGLEHITGVYLQINDIWSLRKFLSSQKLQNVTRSLYIGKLVTVELLLLPKMKHLHYLKMRGCKSLSEIRVDDGDQSSTSATTTSSHYNIVKSSNFSHLRRVSIEALAKLRDLIWLAYIPSLEDLCVAHCPSMEVVVVIIGDPENDNLGIFSRLKYLSLLSLPSLRRISDRPLPFPSLVELQVRDCGNLKKLPLDSNTTTLKRIAGEEHWWNGLQWDDETIRLTFSRSFTPTGPFENFSLSMSRALEFGYSSLIPSNRWITR